MDAQFGLTLAKSDFNTLKEITGNNLSGKVREMLEHFDIEEVQAHLKTERTTIRLDLDLANRITNIAKSLDVNPGKLARAIVECNLHKMHTEH